MFSGVDGNSDGVALDLEDGDLDGVACSLDGVACSLVGVDCDFLYGDFNFAAGELGCFSVATESVAINQRQS